MSKQLFKLADSLRGKTRDIEIDLLRLALIVLSDRTEGYQLYEKKRIKKKIEDQKLNLSWGIDSFCQLEDADQKSLYEAFSTLSLEEMRSFFSDKIINDRRASFQLVTDAGADEILGNSPIQDKLVIIFADILLSAYEKINKLKDVKLFFKNRSLLPFAHVLFDEHIMKKNYDSVEDISTNGSAIIHLGPFNHKVHSEQYKRGLNSHFSQELEIYDLIKSNPTSSIVALLPSSVSFSTSSLAFREFINTTQKIHSVFELSSKVFNFSQLQTFILVLNSIKTGKKIKIKAKDKEEIDINKEDFYSKDDWSLVRHYSTGFKLQKKSIELGQLVLDSFRGPLLKKSESGEEVFVVQNKDLKENDLINAEDILPETYDYKGSLDRYLLEDGDILLVCRGYSFSIGILKDVGKRKLVASSNLLVIRINKKIALPGFIHLFLSSPIGKAELESRQVGTAQIVLSVKDVKSIQVPDLSLKEQEALAASYQDAKSKKEVALQRAESDYKTNIEEVYSRMGVLKEN